MVDTGRAATTAVGRLAALADPEAFAAVTATASLDPTSAVPIAYVDDVAPGIATQSAPSESHRGQLQPKLVGEPDQVPGSAVRRAPSWATPESVGRVRLSGGAAGGGGAVPVSTTSRGAASPPASRLDIRSSVLGVTVARARSTRPFPVTRLVTSAAVHAPATSREAGGDGRRRQPRRCSERDRGLVPGAAVGAVDVDTDEEVGVDRLSSNVAFETAPSSARHVEARGRT